MSKFKFLLPTLLIGSLAVIIHRSITSAASRASNFGNNSFDAIDAYLEGQMHRLHIPGAMLAIIERDQIVHMRGFGKARPGGEIPGPQTPFFIGSLTKSFTALAVMQLVEAGKVDLDAPVQRYLPWFRVANPQASAQMTVRHLLNQTSGLSMLAGSIILDEFDDAPGATERQVRALSTLKINRPVGSKCEYSNLNYNVLGLVVEAASGETYADYINRHIFKPLEMHHSYTTKAAAQLDGLAVGYRHWFSLPLPAPDLPVPIGSLPSGQLISCAEDMARYLITHLNGGRFKDVQLLSELGIEAMHHGAIEYFMMGMSAGSYGMGWFEIDLGQTKTYSHGGNTPDFSAFMAIIPGKERGLVLLANADPYGLPPLTGEVGLNLTALLAGEQPAPIQLDFIQWTMRLLPLIPLLQVFGVYKTLRGLIRWQEHPGLGLTSGKVWWQHVILPLVPNLSLVSILVYLRSSGLLRYLNWFNPDLAWVARISGGFAAIWAVLRTGLVLKALSRSRC
jgi:CubicO group peptidase (beta-lactamase class C family)